MKTFLSVIVAMAIFSVVAQSSYKIVNGKTYSVIDPNAWTVFNDHLKVIGYSEDGIICESYKTETHDAGGTLDHSANRRYISNKVTTIIPGQKIILKNYWQRNAPLESDISPPIKAIRTGQVSIYRSGDSWTTSPVYSGSGYTIIPVSVSVFDMGVDYTPPARALTPEEQKAAENKYTQQEAKTVQWLLKQATNGSVSAETSLGFRYLKGQGVPKDEALGRQWLQKAAADGDAEAASKLATLTTAQTNSVAPSSISSTNSEP